MDETLRTSISDLPLEILEYILQKLLLYPRTLVSASRVSLLWRHLAMQICRNYCLHSIGEILLNELVNQVTHQIHEENYTENCDQDDFWIQVFWNFHETFLDETQERNFIVHQIPSVTHILTEDPYLVVTSYKEIDDESTISVMSSKRFPFEASVVRENVLPLSHNQFSHCPSIRVPGKVFKTCLLFLPTPVLMLICKWNMKAILLSSVEESPGKVDLIEVNVPVHPFKTCSESCFFISQEKSCEENISVYVAAIPSHSKQLDVSLISSVKTEFPTYDIALTGSFITAVETSGHIRMYKIQSIETSSQHFSNTKEKHSNKTDTENRDDEGICCKSEEILLIGESELKKDLRYPNPTVLSKGAIFSSTLISRDLLGYWHMDRDRDYWLIGTTHFTLKNFKKKSKETRERIALHQVTIGATTGLVVTALHFHRGILICGTAQGHLMMYMLKTFSEVDLQKLRGPPMIFLSEAIPGSISRLGSLFTSTAMMVAVGNGFGLCHIILLHLDSIL